MTNPASPWFSPQPETRQRKAAPAWRRPPMDDGALVMQAKDDDWHEGLVEGFAEDIERKIMTGRPGPGVAEAFDKFMRHDHAEMGRDLPLHTGASVAEIKTASFWERMSRHGEAIIDVQGMFLLRFGHLDDDRMGWMTAETYFPEGANFEHICARGNSPAELAADLTSELDRWCRIANPPQKE